MIRNYFIIAIRRLSKQFSYTFINVVGLSVGVASFLLIMMYIQFHLGFDHHIPDIDQLYRVVQIQQAEGVGEQHVAVNMGPLAEALVDDVPEIIDAVRLMSWGKVPVRVNEAYYAEENFVWTDRSVFRLFGVRLLFGDTATALNEPRSLVLSETLAIKYFGDAKKALGQSIEFNNEKGYNVAGIMEDQPQNTHLLMDALVSYESALLTNPWLKSWGSNTMPVYVKLTKDADYKAVSEKLNVSILKYRPPANFRDPLKMYLQPVADIHLHSNHIKFQVNYLQGNSQIVLAFIVVAILIIVIACINFINLAIARSIKRAKEVGVRKVLGANRITLMYQFLGESLIITFLALLLSLLLIELGLPGFNQLLEMNLKLDYIHNPLLNVGLVALWIVVGLFSGIYPALFISRYQAVDVLKGVSGQGLRFGNLLSKSLVVFQFVVAITLVFIVQVSNRQIQFVLNKDLGYNYENVIGIALQSADISQNTELLKNKISQLASVKDVSAASHLNGVAGNQGPITVVDSAQTRIMVRHGYVDEDFFPLMNIQIIEGRNFSKDFSNDINESVILNQAAVKYLGWENPIGKRFKPFTGDTIHDRTVIGVVKDYHYYSIHSKIEPAAYIIYPEGFEVMCVKYVSDDRSEVLAQLEQAYLELFPGTSFIAISAAERLERQYKNDKNSMILFALFSLLALMISAMGLYGLTALRVEQRTKEIGIRKVLGGSIFQMIQLIVKEFVVLIIIAGCFALPLGYYFATQILQQFAYSTKVTWLDGITALALALFIAVITILIRAQQTAKANPVDLIKVE